MRLASPKAIPCIIWGILILTISSLPNFELPGTGFRWEDKLAHFGEYFIFAFLLLFAYHKKIALLVGVSLAVLDELHQLFIPGRHCEFSDFIADFAGVILLLIIIKKRR